MGNFYHRRVKSIIREQTAAKALPETQLHQPSKRGSITKSLKRNVFSWCTHSSPGNDNWVCAQWCSQELYQSVKSVSDSTRRNCTVFIDLGRHRHISETGQCEHDQKYVAHSYIVRVCISQSFCICTSEWSYMLFVLSYTGHHKASE